MCVLAQEMRFVILKLITTSFFYFLLLLLLLFNGLLASYTQRSYCMYTWIKCNIFCLDRLVSTQTTKSILLFHACVRSECLFGSPSHLVFNLKFSHWQTHSHTRTTTTTIVSAQHCIFVSFSYYFRYYVLIDHSCMLWPNERLFSMDPPKQNTNKKKFFFRYTVVGTIYYIIVSIFHS